MPIVMPREMQSLIGKIPPAAEANMLGLASLRQALFDVLGAYPAANVIPYAYSFELSARLSTAVAANATANANIKVTADAAMIGMRITGASKGAYLITPRIDASDRVITNRPIHSSAWVGTGERPNYLDKALLLPANSTISFDVTDLSGASNDIFFSILGFKIYGYTQDTVEGLLA